MESRLSRQEEVQCINSLHVLRRCRDSLVSPLQTSSCLFLFTAPCARHASAHVHTCVSYCGGSFLGKNESETTANKSFVVVGKVPDLSVRGRVSHLLTASVLLFSRAPRSWNTRTKGKHVSWVLRVGLRN